MFLQIRVMVQWLHDFVTNRRALRWCRLETKHRHAFVLSTGRLKPRLTKTVPDVELEVVLYWPYRQ